MLSAGGTIIDEGTGFPPPGNDFVQIPPGDANGDGVVDFLDLQVWSDHFMQDANLAFLEGDFNLDGFTDGADYIIWADNMTLPPPATAAPVASALQQASLPAAEQSVDTLAAASDDAFSESDGSSSLSATANLIAESVAVPRLETGAITSGSLSPSPAAPPTTTSTQSASAPDNSDSLFETDSLLPWASVAHDFQVAADDAADCLKPRTAKR